MKYVRHTTKEICKKEFFSASAGAILLFVVALIVNYYAGNYATRIESSPVTDIILSNIRVYDVDGLFVYGSYIFTAFVFLLVIRDLASLPFVIKSISLFTIIRAMFISMTHLGTFPTQIAVDSNFFSKISAGGDLFFSGHTGLPFLLALIYWENPLLRYTFLGISLVFAVVVLLGHLHYTIDVMSAFFITFSIYHLAKFLFTKDYELFMRHERET